MSALAAHVTVHAAGPASVDQASVVAIAADGAVVGRATLSRLYGARGEVRLELAPTAAIALALVDGLERDASARGLGQLELAAGDLPGGVIEALRRSRPARDNLRGTHPRLTWPTSHPSLWPSTASRSSARPASRPELRPIRGPTPPYPADRARFA
jgi:hypothetical protein